MISRPRIGSTAQQHLASSRTRTALRSVWALAALGLIGCAVGCAKSGSTESDENGQGGSGGSDSGLDANADGADTSVDAPATDGKADVSVDVVEAGDEPDAADDVAAEAADDAADDQTSVDADQVDSPIDTGVDAGEDACTGCTCKVEKCNGIDDNCNGLIDEGDPGGGAACQTTKPGVCSDGTMHCQNGGVRCVQNTAASAEVCDSLDNNCDGQTDEDDPSLGASCSTGLKGICGAGSKSCLGGQLICTPTFQPDQQAEVCNGLDDNCDGVVDEGNPGGNVACDTGKLGVCADGLSNCTGGQLKCVQQVKPSPEVCDGADNDCNGTIDDPASVNGNPCTADQPPNFGVCAAGLTSCVTGVPSCIPTIKPGTQTESCNGLDDDCDGVIDNGVGSTQCATQYPAAQYVASWSCGVGACSIQQCVTGHANVDASVSNGCECSNTVYSASCASPTVVSIPYRGVATRKGVITEAAGTAYFRPTFTGWPNATTNPSDPGTVHFLVELTDPGGGNYTLDVLDGSDCTKAVACPVEGAGGSSSGVQVWELRAVHDAQCPQAGDGTVPSCSNDITIADSPVTVRVRRTNGQPQCDSFTVTFSNLDN